jgi:hypothetical protein
VENPVPLCTSCEGMIGTVEIGGNPAPHAGFSMVEVIRVGRLAKLRPRLEQKCALQEGACSVVKGVSPSS